MKKQISTHGVIYKKEYFAPVKNVQGKATIIEASRPYAHYYGQRPLQAKPNSIFIPCSRFYYLEELAMAIKEITDCLPEPLDIASAIICKNGYDIPSVRIKNFPDYKHLEELTACLIKAGIELKQTDWSEQEYAVRIQKRFSLLQVGDLLFLDAKEPDKGYLVLEKKLNFAPFEETMRKVKNNVSCGLFDAAHGVFFIDNLPRDTIRIYAEGIRIENLSCLQKTLNKLL